MLHTNFHENRSTDYFEVFLPYMDVAAILAFSWRIFISLYLVQAYIHSLAENGPVVTEKSKFNSHM